LRALYVLALRLLRDIDLRQNDSRRRLGAHRMGWKNRLVERGKQLAMTPRVLRVLSDDRVMRAAEGVMDARNRVRAAAEKANEAWHLLTYGHALPPIDPSIVDDVAIEVRTTPAETPANGGTVYAPTEKINGNGTVHTNGNGHMGNAHAHHSADGKELAASMASRTSLSAIGGRDVFEKAYQFRAADNARKMGVYPFFRPLDLNDGPEAVLEGRRVVMFGSNNYLGLTTHPRVREAARDAINKFGTSMTGSRLVNGSMKLHNELEEKLAAYFGKESALVFTTGYQVNLAVISALLSNKKCVAVIDRNDHASIYDGVRLGQAVGARMVRYKHNDAESLDRTLSELAPDEGAFVITDGVFSAEGEIANLPDLNRVVKKHGARLFVDDAHALGVIGPSGRGTAAHFGIGDQIDLMGGTFSKSLASIGGWLVGERKVLDYVQHFASSFMFAASAAPPSVAAAMAALEVMQEETWRIDQLRKNYTYMREELKKMGFDVGQSQTAVIPVYVRQDLRTIMMWKELLDVHGVYTNPFISPGVPPKQAMLRTSYMATHTKEHLDRGLAAFHATGKKFGVI
jgi:8-amino-7-oxononanoate synthase